MLEARLNIECDTTATKMHTKLNPSQYPNKHPLIPNTHLYLAIESKHVIQWVKQNISEASIPQKLAKEIQMDVCNYQQCSVAHIDHCHQLIHHQ